MGFRELVKKIGEKQRERKEMFRIAEEKLRIQQKLENRMKSANERELERFMKEEREEQIKDQLDIMKKKRREDITFNHNSLNIKNITNHVDWEVLKEKNQFAGNKNIFSNSEFIHKNNPDLFKNNRRICSI